MKITCVIVAVLLLQACGGNVQSPVTQNTNVSVILTSGKVYNGITNINEGVYTNTSYTLYVTNGNYTYNHNIKVLTYGVINTWTLSSENTNKIFRMNYKRLSGQSEWIVGVFTNIIGDVFEYKNDYTIWKNNVDTTWQWTLSSDSNYFIVIFPSSIKTTNEIYWIKYSGEEYLGFGKSQTEYYKE